MARKLRTPPSPASVRSRRRPGLIRDERRAAPAGCDALRPASRRCVGRTRSPSTPISRSPRATLALRLRRRWARSWSAGGCGTLTRAQCGSGEGDGRRGRASTGKRAPGARREASTTGVPTPYFDGGASKLGAFDASLTTAAFSCVQLRSVAFSGVQSRLEDDCGVQLRLGDGGRGGGQSRRRRPVAIWQAPVSRKRAMEGARAQ
jgi:hypothetical protein